MGIRASSALVLAWLLVAAAAGAGGESALLTADEVGLGWEIVREAPTDPARDPDLVRWGVREQHVRHYTRSRYGMAEVCSVEVWDFASTEQARAAEAGFQYPDWQISRAGMLLVMVRGLVRDRELKRPPVRGVFPDCDAIGSRIRARASGL